jgi:hypothetical protein
MLHVVRIVAPILAAVLIFAPVASTRAETAGPGPAPTTGQLRRPQLSIPSRWIILRSTQNRSPHSRCCS